MSDKKQKRLGTIESLIATLQGLINNADDITALNGGKYLTTRISNNIVELRDKGITIITERIELANKKHYGRYKLAKSKDNLVRAKRLLKAYSNMQKSK
ncbi:MULTISPECIES: helix-turn-helix domain-containing protein [unclassified Campylobacter]|uniref:helix-turn-helix domain-containing protein n=1 Tax=unclassified Campylobacter TaxID=2593542 RepID=UPI0022E9BE5F|nr:MULTISPECIES: helix-turn-helix domain-containing protein [unclassified Campylobacter]MDA3062836.1 hypothetical protein [Campylobacter sp. JMF_14 EL1]MDA3073730.1 hypothetical protein [Campylobacter sp. JMF_10 EL2]